MIDLEGEVLMPGIINLQKYSFGLSYNAMPTLFHTPVTMSPADLAASQVDIAILGAATDMGTGMRGAAHEPAAVRHSNVHGGYGPRPPVDPGVHDRHRHAQARADGSALPEPIDEEPRELKFGNSYLFNWA